MNSIHFLARVVVTAVLVVCTTGRATFAQEAASRCTPGSITTSELRALDLESLLNVKVITASKFSESQSDAPGVISVVSEDELRRFGRHDAEGSARARARPCREHGLLL
jgi:outer membrane receptor for ferrienterochelin and colicin